MTVSLIVTTYNRPEALELALLSALRQKCPPDEIVVADDGSERPTAEIVKKMDGQNDIPIVHVWQPDEGFRAAMARNRAIAMAKGEYVIMVDGDMILHSDFVKDHKEAAEKGVFVQGSRVLLNEYATKEAIMKKRLDFTFFSSGIENRKNALQCRFLSGIFSKKSHSLRGIKTCNFALFRDDILLVNGFDNLFVGWGREDSDFAVRLFNAGLVRKNLKFSAIAYHLHHPENTRQCLPENDRRLQRSIDGKRIRCEDGIDRFLGPDDSV